MSKNTWINSVKDYCNNNDMQFVLPKKDSELHGKIKQYHNSRCLENDTNDTNVSTDVDNQPVIKKTRMKKLAENIPSVDVEGENEPIKKVRKPRAKKIIE